MQILRHPLLQPAPGTQREIVSLHYGQTGGPKAYIQASLHGDELPGMMVAYHLCRQLDALEAAGQIAGEIVLVPMANPIGLSQFMLHAHLGRFELTTGENFNRHYPDQIGAVAAEAEPLLGSDSAANVAVLRRLLKAAVLAAPTLGYSTGPSGNHLLALIERWGLSAALAGRLVQAPPGVPVAQLVARGDAELGFQQMPEVAGQSGITVLGALPGAAAQITTFSAALGLGTAHADAACAALALFNDEAAAAIKRRCGLEPASR